MLGRFPLILCVTGEMAAGKNYICSQYEKQGWLCKDADKDVHQAIELAKNDILAAFGTKAKEMNLKIQNNDGTLNRKELGKLLFTSPELLKKQEQIVYPYVISITKDFIAANKDKNIILNATLLYKTPELLSLCDSIVYVKANLIKRIIRARKRDNLPFLQIFKRFYSQRNLYKEYKKTGIQIKTVKN